MRVCMRMQGSKTKGTANCRYKLCEYYTPLHYNGIYHSDCCHYDAYILIGILPFDLEKVWQRFSEICCLYVQSILEVPVFDRVHFANNSQIKLYISLICDNNVTTRNLWILTRKFQRFWSDIIFYECKDDSTALQRRVSQTASWHYTC